MLKFIKSYMMPIAMFIGIIFYVEVSKLAWITPYLIGLMLFFTYSKIDYKKIKFTKFHLVLLAAQLLGSFLVYIILLPFNEIVAQGAMICILAPTATAAPVITGILGGNIESLATYSLFCNIVMAFVAPICFALTGTVSATSFLQAVLLISENVFILLILPFIIAVLLDLFSPKAHAVVKSWTGISFYLWSFSLIIITGKTVSFVIQEATNYILEVSLAIAALLVCIAQFITGRYIGRKLDNTISGGQGLGQKNTILAIWMAQTYLNPISSVAPGAYVLWQNIINSYQVWRKARNS